MKNFLKKRNLLIICMIILINSSVEPDETNKQMIAEEII